MNYKGFTITKAIKPKKGFNYEGPFGPNGYTYGWTQGSTRDAKDEIDGIVRENTKKKEEIYKGYTIRKVNSIAWAFQHEDFDPTPETYFSEHEQTPSSDDRCGVGTSIEDAKEQIDQLDESSLYNVIDEPEIVDDFFAELDKMKRPKADNVVDVFSTLGDMFNPQK